MDRNKSNRLSIEQYYLTEDDFLNQKRGRGAAQSYSRDPAKPEALKTNEDEAYIENLIKTGNSRASGTGVPAEKASDEKPAAVDRAIEKSAKPEDRRFSLPKHDGVKGIQPEDQISRSLESFDEEEKRNQYLNLRSSMKKKDHNMTSDAVATKKTVFSERKAESAEIEALKTHNESDSEDSSLSEDSASESNVRMRQSENTMVEKKEKMREYMSYGAKSDAKGDKKEKSKKQVMFIEKEEVPPQENPVEEKREPKKAMLRRTNTIDVKKTASQPVPKNEEPIEELPQPTRMKSKTLNTRKESEEDELRSSNFLLEYKSRSLNDSDPIRDIEKEDELCNVEEIASLKSRLILKSVKNVEFSNPLELKELNDLEDAFFGQEHQLGHPKCLTISRSYSAIGTSLGVTCFFEKDSSKYLKTLGNISECFHMGSAIAIDVSHDERVLASGHENGQICLFDIKQGRMLKEFAAVHRSTVLALKFVHIMGNSLNNSRVVSSDSGGGLYRTNFEKSMFSYTFDRKSMLDKNFGQICGIEVFPHEFRSNNSVILNTRLIGISSLLTCQVLNLESFSQIFAIPRPYYVKPTTPPSFSWNEPSGPVFDSVFFIISWDITIFLLKLQLNHKSVDSPLHISLHRQMYLGYAILYSTFICADIIWSLNERKEVFCIHLDEFKQEQKIPARTESNYEPGKRRMSIERNEIFKPRVLMSLQQKVLYHPMIRDSDNCVRFCYHIGFYPIKSTARLYYVSDEKFQIFNLENVRSYVKRYSGQGKWLHSMSVLSSVSRGKLLCLAGIPSGEAERAEATRDLVCETAMNYIMINNALLNQGTSAKKSKVEEISSTVVEFLLKNRQVEFIFDQVQISFKALGFWEEFMASLEPFILLRKFRKIPNDTLQAVVTYYKNCKKLDLVQRMLMHLDLEGVETFHLLNLCLEHHLFKAVTYVCCIVESDYLTPLVKFFKTFKEKLEKRAKFADYSKYGYRCFWYLKMCLCGRNVVGQSISPEIYDKVLITLTLWMFEFSIIRALIEFDAKLTYEILFLFFQGRPAERIAKNQSKLNFPLKNKEEENPKFIDPESLKPHSRMIKVVLEADKSLVDERNKQYPEKEHSFKYIFFARLIEKNYCIPRKFELIQEAIIYLIEHASSLSYLYKTDKGPELSKDELEMKTCDFLIGMIKIIKGELKGQSLNEMSGKAEVSPLDKVTCYLSELKKDYKRCFDLFLQSKNGLFKKEIFDFLERALEELEDNKDEENFKKLKNCMLDHLTDLVSVNSDRTHSIISKYNKNAEKSVIKNLAAYPKLQREYLEKILSVRIQSPSLEIDKDLLVLHVELLCKEKAENELLYNLKKFDYPLDEIEKLCEKFEMNEALAFILERTGAVDRAVDLYIKKIGSLLEDHIKNVEKMKPTDEKTLAERVNVILEVCKMHKNYDKENSHVLWFHFLDKMIDIKKNLFWDKMNEPKYSRLCKCFLQIFSGVFDQIAKNVALGSLVQSLKEKYGKLELAYVKNTLSEMISNQLYEQSILEKAKNIVIENISFENSNLRLKTMRGYDIFPYCYKCNKVYENREVIQVFFCGHSYHRSCQQESLCFLCAKDDTYNFFQAIARYKAKYEKMISTNKKRVPEEKDKEVMEEEKDDSGPQARPQNAEKNNPKTQFRAKSMLKLRNLDKRQTAEREAVEYLMNKYYY